MIDRSSMRAPWYWFVCLLVAALAAGCTTVKLVADYDEQIDKGATALQKDMETFLVKLESSADTPKAKVEAYLKHKQFYDDSQIAVRALRVRADATERNSLTVRMLDRIESNLLLMQDMDKEGLERQEIALLRGAFTSQFTAVLTFELAKKRGEKPDENKATAAATQVVIQKELAK